MSAADLERLVRTNDAKACTDLLKRDRASAAAMLRVAVLIGWYTLVPLFWATMNGAAVPAYVYAAPNVFTVLGLLVGRDGITADHVRHAVEARCSAEDARALLGLGLLTDEELTDLVDVRDLRGRLFAVIMAAVRSDAEHDQFIVDSYRFVKYPCSTIRLRRPETIYDLPEYQLSSCGARLVTAAGQTPLRMDKILPLRKLLWNRSYSDFWDTLVDALDWRTVTHEDALVMASILQVCGYGYALGVLYGRQPEAACENLRTFGYTRCVNLILHATGDDVSIRCLGDDNPLDAAVRRNDLEAVRALMPTDNDCDCQHLLKAAILHDSVDVFRFLFQSRAWRDFVVRDLYMFAYSAHRLYAGCIRAMMDLRRLEWNGPFPTDAAADLFVAVKGVENIRRHNLSKGRVYGAVCRAGHRAWVCKEAYMSFQTLPSTVVEIYTSGRHELVSELVSRLEHREAVRVLRAFPPDDLVRDPQAMRAYAEALDDLSEHAAMLRENTWAEDAVEVFRLTGVVADKMPCADKDLAARGILSFQVERSAVYTALLAASGEMPEALADLAADFVCHRTVPA